MDLTKPSTIGHQAVVAKQQHDPAPPRGSGVAAGGFPFPFEVFVLNDQNKWRKFDPEIFLSMITKYVLISSYLVKANDLYYCGTPRVWRLLEDKGDKRRWLHDLVIDSIPEWEDGWLDQPLKQNVAI